MEHRNLKQTAYKETELKKHVNAIHCTNNLTLVQRKLFNALLFNAYSGLQHKSTFQIQARKLCTLIGYNSNDYGKLKKALLGLITIAIEWNVIDSASGKEGQWKASSILSAAELANGLCRYEYSQIMKELLFRPDIYGRIDISVMSKFKSNYGLALYENCVRYQGLPQTPWFPLDVFRRLMGVLGDKYSVFKDFKKRVLNIAVEEVNKLSQISITPEVERQNQKVVKIRFQLSKHKINTEKLGEQLDNQTPSILEKIFGLSESLIKELYAKYEADYIRDKVAIIMGSDSFVSGKIRALPGYLIDSLRKDYKQSKSSKAIVDEQRNKIEQEERGAREKEENLRTKYESYIHDKLANYFSSLTDSEYQCLLNDFELDLKAGSQIFRKWYRQKGLEHPGVKACFNEFVKKNKKEEIGELMTEDVFFQILSDYS